MWLLLEYFNAFSPTQPQICVGENALKDIPATTLLHAVVDEQVKKQVVQQGVLNSMTKQAK